MEKRKKHLTSSETDTLTSVKRVFSTSWLSGIAIDPPKTIKQKLERDQKSCGEKRVHGDIIA